jgi:hypothetical protein
MIYQPTPPPAPRVQIYDNTPPKTLGDYSGRAPASKHLPRPGESAWAFKARTERTGLRHLSENLPPAELEAVAAAYNGAVEHLEGGTVDQQVTQTPVARWNEVRGSLGLANVVDRGIFGTSSPQERAMALGGRFGGREIERNGGLANSIGPAPARVDMAAAWERQRLPEYAQRTEIPAGSSGTGFLGVDR